MIFLDTDVLIDCLRGLPAADAWLRESADQQFAIPGIVAMELLPRRRRGLQVISSLGRWSTRFVYSIAVRSTPHGF